MAHIGIERLTTGDGQEHGREHGQGEDRARIQDVGQRIIGVDGGQNARRFHDAAQAEKAQHHEPEQHERAEDPADPRCSHPLDGEQPDQNDNRDRDDVVLEPMGVDREALNGAEHRNGGRDCPVSVEQGCADKAHDDEVHAPGTRGDTPDAEQREECDDAALAAVICLQDEDAVLDRDDDDEGPEDQGEDAQNSRGGQATVACRVRGLLERIKRAGSDIAKHNAQSAENSSSGEVIAPGAMERDTGGRSHGASPSRLFWIPGCLRETDAMAPVPLSSKRPSVVLVPMPKGPCPRL